MCVGRTRWTGVALESMGRSNRKKIRLETYEPNEGDVGLLSGSLISLWKIQNSLDDPVSHSVRRPSSLTPSFCPPRSPVIKHVG